MSSPTYLLDTDTCSYIMKRTHPTLLDRIREFAPGELKLSSISVYELEYGVRRSNRHEQLTRVVEGFLANVEVLPLDAAAALEAGAIRAELAAAGSPIGAYDLLIAGHCRALGATLITNNVREFSRVDALTVESWTTTSS
ncbi:MAG: type II toxin-antitoxin system VapC family toxin [Acidobacteriota bacterium]